MGFTFQEFPNADFYDSDLRELLCMMRKLEKKYNGELDKVLKKLIYEKLNDLFVGAVYDAENERLKLGLGGKLFADGDHIYDSNNSSITILDEENEGGDVDVGELC